MMDALRNHDSPPLSRYRLGLQHPLTRLFPIIDSDSGRIAATADNYHDAMRQLAALNTGLPATTARCGGGGNMIDVPLRRRPTWPDRAMRWVWRGFWTAFLLVLAIMVAMVAMVLS